MATQEPPARPEADGRRRYPPRADRTGGRRTDDGPDSLAEAVVLFLSGPNLSCWASANPRSTG